MTSSDSDSASRPLVLVDDEPLILESFGLLLRTHLSCPVYTFSDPVQALQQLVALNPAMVVSDYLMPGMNGLKFLSQAQRFIPDAHFLIITGGAIEFESDELQLLPSLKGVIRKPIHWKKLAEFVVANWPTETPPSIREAALAK